MTKRLFTEKEQAQLKRNPHIRSVSNKAIIRSRIPLHKSPVSKVGKENEIRTIYVTPGKLLQWN